MITRLAKLAQYSALLFVLSAATLGQQTADPDFKATVEHPAYTKIFPRVLFDEGHNNFHTANGRYKPFADLIMVDGYHLVRGRKPFNKETLDTFKVLVIADALGAEDVDDEGADRPAFTEQECEAVRDWVHEGGSLLLIAGPGALCRGGQKHGESFQCGYEQSRDRRPGKL